MQDLTHYLNNEKVCQTIFLNTWNISLRVVQTATKKKEDGNLVAADMMRKIPLYVKYDLVTLNEVKNHIKKFPVMQNHYNIEGTKRQYLASNLNITKMYDLFALQSPDTTVHEQF